MFDQFITPALFTVGGVLGAALGFGTFGVVALFSPLEIIGLGVAVFGVVVVFASAGDVGGVSRARLC
jgi:hypothetical protein